MRTKVSYFLGNFGNFGGFLPIYTKSFLVFIKKNRDSGFLIIGKNRHELLKKSCL